MAGQTSFFNASKYKTETRVKQLKLMHQLMCTTNDEGLYITWVSVGVPDCPQDDDFELIAEDNDAYNNICELFTRLVAEKGFRH